MELERLKQIVDSNYSILLELYKTTIDMYKFFWEVGLKLNFFFYTGTGIIYSFWIQNQKDSIELLYLPMIFSGLFGGLCYCCLILASSFDGWFCGYLKRLLMPFWDYENLYDHEQKEKGRATYHENDEDLKYFYWPHALPFQIFLGISALGSFVIFLYLLNVVFGICSVGITSICVTLILFFITPPLKNILLEPKK